MSEIHIQGRTESDVLLQNPELVLQHMSFRIHARREALIRELIGKTVYYAKPGGAESAYTLKSVDDNQNALIVNSSGARRTVSVRRLYTRRSK